MDIPNFISNSARKRFIIKNNIIKYECAVCKNQGQHNGFELKLQLDHKDGNNANNQIINLQFLCPNCHSQTETYAGKNHKRKERVSLREEDILIAYKETDNINQLLISLGADSSNGNYRTVYKVLDKHGLSRSKKKIETINKILNRSKIKPTKEALIRLIETTPIQKIAELFHLRSNMSVRKWCIGYGIDYKTLSPFSRK